MCFKAQDETDFYEEYINNLHELYNNIYTKMEIKRKKYRIQFKPIYTTRGVREFFNTLERFKNKYIISGLTDHFNIMHITFWRKSKYTIDKVDKILKNGENILYY